MENLEFGGWIRGRTPAGRWATVDESALLAALRSGELHSAGLDGAEAITPLPGTPAVHARRRAMSW